MALSTGNVKFTVLIPVGSLATNSIYFGDLRHLIKELGLLLGLAMSFRNLFALDLYKKLLQISHLNGP